VPGNCVPCFISGIIDRRDVVRRYPWGNLELPKKSDGANASRKIDSLVGLVLFSVEVVLLALFSILGSSWSEKIEKSSSANEWQCIVIGSILAFCTSWQMVALAETKTYQKWPSTVVVTM